MRRHRALWNSLINEWVRQNYVLRASYLQGVFLSHSHLKCAYFQLKFFPNMGQRDCVGYFQRNFSVLLQNWCCSIVPWKWSLPFISIIFCVACQINQPFCYHIDSLLNYNLRTILTKNQRHFYSKFCMQTRASFLTQPDFKFIRLFCLVFFFFVNSSPVHFSWGWELLVLDVRNVFVCLRFFLYGEWIQIFENLLIIIWNFRPIYYF